MTISVGRLFQSTTVWEENGENEGSQFCSMGQGSAVDGRVLWVFLVGVLDVHNCKLGRDG